MQKQGSVGIYCLANDKVLDWMIAFLESLRYYESDISLIVIPFDDNVEQLTRLAQKYRFTFLQDGALEELDQIGATFPPYKYAGAHMFRKFAAFWGPFDHFLFLDLDIVILAGLQELLHSYLSSPCNFVCFDCDIEQAYRPGALRDRMISEYSTHGFNAGAFMSSKGVFTLDSVKASAVEAASVKESFAEAGDQPFFNYCVDTIRLHAKDVTEIAPDVSSCAWAALRSVRETASGFRVMDRRSPHYNKRLLFIHWAGFKCNPYMPNRHTFIQRRMQGCPTRLARLRYRYEFYILRLLTPKNCLRWLYGKYLQRHPLFMRT